MNIKIRKLLYEFNNLCRKDRSIKGWVNYINGYGELQTDIDFIDYNDNVYNYHNVITPLALSGISPDDIKNYAIFMFENIKNSFAKEMYEEE